MENPNAREMVRLLHVVAPSDVGGLERVVQALSRVQACAGHAVHVAAILDRGRADHPFLAPLREGDVKLYAREFAPRAYYSEARFVAKLLRDLRPDVVHTHGYRADVVTGSVARRFGVATVTTVHGFTRGGLKNRFYEFLQRRSHRRFDAVVPVSRPLADELQRRGVPEGRLHVIPNAWLGDGEVLTRPEARRILGIEKGTEPLLGWVGRLSREKGADVLLDALAELRDLPLHVAFVGEGKQATPLRKRAEALGVTARATWCGRIRQAGRLFSAFDLFVLSSRSEGTPMVLFEAMEVAVPIVAASVGGVPDMLSENEAWLVPPEDPHALAKAVREALENAEVARERARGARERLLRDFDAAGWAQRYLEIYRSLTGGSVGTSRVPTSDAVDEDGTK